MYGVGSRLPRRALGHEVDIKDASLEQTDCRSSSKARQASKSLPQQRSPRIRRASSHVHSLHVNFHAPSPGRQLRRWADGRLSVQCASRALAGAPLIVRISFAAVLPAFRRCAPELPFRAPPMTSNLPSSLTTAGVGLGSKSWRRSLFTVPKTLGGCPVLQSFLPLPCRDTVPLSPHVAVSLS